MKELFLSVLEISLTTGLVILVMLAVSPALNKRYAAKWKYGIWILLALRLAFPVSISLPEKQLQLEVPARMTAPIAFTVSNTAPLPIQPQLPQTHQVPQIAPLDILAWIWLIGAATFLTMHLIAYFRYRSKVLKNGVPKKNGEFTGRLRSLCRDLNLRGNIPVLVYDKAASPMVLGFFRPILVFPAGDYTGEDLFFVLKHELIHLKRHDVFGKFLLVLANSVHWFNPLVYLMQKEAVVDMELSCDERVVRDIGFERKKAYTETLLATLCRQYKKSTVFSTQFYGGKEIMKKRFQNILNRSKKRNGFLILAIAVTATLILGLATGCSAEEPEQTRELQNLQQTQAAGEPALGVAVVNLDGTGKSSGRLNIRKQPSVMSEAVGTLKDGEKVEILEIQGDWGRIDRGWIVLGYVDLEPELAEDSSVDPKHREQVAALSVAMGFARARFRNDLEAMLPYMVNTWEGMFWNVTFDGTPVISEHVKVVPRSGDISTISTEPVSLRSKTVPAGSTTTMSVSVKDDKGEDNLIVCLIREEEGWKVYDFGFEFYEHFFRQEEPAAPVEDANDEYLPSEPAPSEPGENTEAYRIQSVALAFVKAFFEGDLQTAESYYDSDVLDLSDVTRPVIDLDKALGGGIQFTPNPYDMSANSLNSENVPVRSSMTVTLDLKDAGAPRGYEQFVMLVVKQEDGWKVEVCGYAPEPS